MTISITRYDGQPYDLQARHTDVLEIFYSTGLSAEQAVIGTAQHSDECYVVTLNGKQICWYGVCPSEAGGIIWLIASDDFYQVNRRVIYRTAKQTIEQWVQTYGYLYNWMYSKNEPARRFLQVLGFSFHTEPIYLSNEPFILFWRKQHVC